MTVGQGKYVAFAVQFQNCDQTDIAIKDLFTCTAGFSMSAAGAASDQIWLWDTAVGNWDKYFYQGGRGTKATGWTKIGETELIGDNITATAGQTVFFLRYGNETAITLSGAVKPFLDSKETSFVCGQGQYLFVSYPWPEVLKVAKFSEFYPNGVKPAMSATGASSDQIWLWDTNKGDWDKYFYQGGRGSKAEGWTKLGETELTTDSIPVGAGFYYLRYGNEVTLTFKHIAAE